MRVGQDSRGLGREEDGSEKKRRHYGVNKVEFMTLANDECEALCCARKNLENWVRLTLSIALRSEGTSIRSTKNTLIVFKKTLHA